MCSVTTKRSFANALSFLGMVLASLEVHAMQNHHNPQEVAHYLSTLSLEPESDLSAVESVIATLDNPSHALDQLHPAIFGAYDLLNVNATTQIASIFEDRTAQICAKHLGDCSSDANHFWVAPFGYLMNQDQIGEQVGYSADLIGVLAGYDYTFCSQVSLGIGGGYTEQFIGWKRHRGRGSVIARYLGIYMDWLGKHFSIEAAVIGGVNSNSAKRHIHFASLNRHAKHTKNGSTLAAHLGCGYDFKISRFHLKPFANADYVYLYTGSFKEHGADSLNLHVDKRSTNMLRSELGLSGTQSFKMGNGCFSPVIWISGINEVYLPTEHFEAHLRHEEGNFKVRSFNKAITLVSPGIDLSFTTDNGCSLLVRYSAELNNYIATHKGDIEFAWAF